MLKFNAILCFTVVLFSTNFVIAQEMSSYHQILASKNIVEISQYLKKLNSDNPQYKSVLNRLKQLKNGSMQSEPRLLISAFKNIESPEIKTPLDSEKEEFHKLMKESAEIHDKKAVKLLNNIFSKDTGNNESVLLVRNDSSCDIILRLQGKKQYNIAVPSKGENFINLNKDSYMIKGKVCNSEYFNTKDLSNNQIITLRYSEKN